MKQLIFLIIVSSILGAMSSCDSDEGHICSNEQVKVLGECIEKSEKNLYFVGYPDFYCYNDSVAVSINTTSRYNVIHVNVYPYIQDRGVGKNWLIGGLRGAGYSSWKFYERCYQSPEDNSQYHTFLFVLDGDKINEDTKEIHCRLELRDGIYVGDFDPEIVSTLLDSSTVVLKRLFY